MSSKLRRTTTMQKTSEEGINYLKREWGEDRLSDVQRNIDQRHKLLNETNNDEDIAEEIENDASVSVKKPKLAKFSTMKNTAAEAKNLLKDVEIDQDAKTRHQSKAINELIKPASDETITKTKKSSLRKFNSMKATAKEGSELLKGESLGDTRANTKAKKAFSKKPRMRKTRTMDQTAKEGKQFVKSFEAKNNKIS